MPSLPAATRRSLFVYNAFFPLVFGAMLPGLLARMFRRGGFRENFSQRLGRYDAATRARLAEGRWWWIHSISVGETLVALKLARELHRRAPALRLALSVTTSTGYALALKSRSDWLEVIYNPIDTGSIVRAALDLIRPERLILIEGEAWPNLLAECHARAIPVALVNARLSPRSERRMLTGRFWIAPIFALLDCVCVPEAAEIARWQSLGIPAARLRVTGSIKFDSADEAAPTRVAEFRALLAGLGVADEAPILVAGSTWAPEERIIAEIFRELRREFPRLFLVIVPRHVERTADLLRELAPLGLHTVRRSTLPSSQPATPDVLLVDTTGELRDWYALATVVFVGKSLPGVAERGGQNPAEPTGLGKPVVFGPHMENFTSVVELLHTNSAAFTVSDPNALTATLRQLLQSPALCSAIGGHAREALLTHHGATARTATALLPAD